MKKLITLIKNWQGKCKCAGCKNFREQHLKLLNRCHGSAEKINMLIRNIREAV